MRWPSGDAANEREPGPCGRRGSAWPGRPRRGGPDDFEQEPIRLRHGPRGTNPRRNCRKRAPGMARRTLAHEIRFGLPALAACKNLKVPSHRNALLLQDKHASTSSSGPQTATGRVPQRRRVHRFPAPGRRLLEVNRSLSEPSAPGVLTALDQKRRAGPGALPPERRLPASAHNTSQTGRVPATIVVSSPTRAAEPILSLGRSRSAANALQPLPRASAESRGGPASSFLGPNDRLLAGSARIDQQPVGRSLGRLVRHGHPRKRPPPRSTSSSQGPREHDQAENLVGLNVTSRRTGSTPGPTWRRHPRPSGAHGANTRAEMHNHLHPRSNFVHGRAALPGEAAANKSGPAARMLRGNGRPPHSPPPRERVLAPGKVPACSSRGEK